MLLSKGTADALLLMLVYLGFLALALVVCAFIGYEVDELWGSGIGVTLSLGAFFVSCWICWVLAVRVTAPRRPT